MQRSTKERFALRIAIVAVLVVVSIGVALLVLHATSVELALFEFITFGIGISALMLAVLGSINTSYQVRMTRRIAKEVHTSISELKEIGKLNAAMHRRINQDYELARDIAEALAEAGIIEDDTKRRAVAGRIEQKVRTKMHRAK